MSKLSQNITEHINVHSWRVIISRIGIVSIHLGAYKRALPAKELYLHKFAKKLIVADITFIQFVALENRKVCVFN